MYAPLRVDHMRQVHGRKERLDQLLAELAFHETVGRDLARVAAVDGQLERNAFHKWNGQRILHVAR